MNIAYPVRGSKFTEPCEAVIRAQSEALADGRVVEVPFSGDDSKFGEKPIRVTIQDTPSDQFATDWESSDASWFPARIKGAAQALHNCRCYGQYEISHKDNLLTIRKV